MFVCGAARRARVFERGLLGKFLLNFGTIIAICTLFCNSSAGNLTEAREISQTFQKLPFSQEAPPHETRRVLTQLLFALTNTSGSGSFFG